MRGIRGLIAVCLASLAIGAQPAHPAEPQVVRAAVLRVEQGNPLPISRLDLPPADLGFAGARLANDDNQTTGRFMGQTFEVIEADATPETAAATLEQLIAQGASFIVTMADAETTVALADAAGERALVLNATSPDDRLRNELCRANTLHVAPSRAMLADALAQFLTWKKWDEWFLIEGSHPNDRAMAEAYRRAARKFGAKVVEERVFADTGGARRTDTGHVQVQKQMPVFTQDTEDHDVVITADESDIFAAYLPYQTWEPRPVAGSAGLRPVTWHPTQEAWGATQFQRRFERLSGRYMRPVDFQVWAALRVLGEAATRTRSTDYAVLRDYILGPEFELAAFKGQKLTFRPWNHQLRQPILLIHDRVMVSVSPQQEFLHQVSRLDTLGWDEPESTCKLN
ncbi:ABC transporter substrate-binding protein [Limibaculum sp. M0105]|uniref:ABC transporter substrate-binding protein n=1 Tax=Thermohalobaculum xanthum TaxID=2753746 RepID=A0A8J7M7P0_9RHOB|nr:ABC transporter substrate-binding protein [Thermohalobaculum xanthum]MBK0399869.1 ABC transporter substrate-binding protein [Thermohalobaculum xanthum]